MSENETPDDEPITPEVVDGGGAGGGRGASARKRRPGGPTGARPAADPGAGAGAPSSGGRPVGAGNGGIFRIGCFALMLVGVLGVFTGGSQVADPAGVQCRYARQAVDDADDQDVEDWDHVPLPEGVEEAKELDCDDAVARAGDLPDDEDESLCGQARDAIEDNGLPEGIDDAGDIPCDEVDELTASISGFDPTAPSGTFTSEGQFRSVGIFVLLVGAAQAIAAFFLFRTRRRQIRTVALVATALGILTGGGGAGIIGLVVLVFAVYALAFSADARALFPPNPNGGGFLRPRMPKPQPPAE